MRHPLFSGEGARRFGGRWNPSGFPVIYAADSIATSLLEILVHTRGVKPPGTLGWIEIDVPEGVSTEKAEIKLLPGWDDPSNLVTQQFVEKWIREGRSCVLWVPSVAASGHAWNAVLNVEHSEFALLTASDAKPLELDARLFP